MSEFRPPAVVRADVDLTLAFRTGDEWAVRELFDRYGALVFTIAERLVGAGADAAEVAADITSHTFLQAWRNSEAFEPGRALAPWLTSLAVRVAAESADPPVDVAAGVALADELLAASTGLDHVPAGLDDRVVAAVLSEATIDPAEVYTAADLLAARSGQRSMSVGSYVLGAIGGLLFLLVGILVFSAIAGGDGGSADTRTIELRPTGRLSDVSGSIEVGSSDAGLSIVLSAPTLTDRGAGQWYEGWILLVDGSLVSAGTFRTGDDVGLTAAVEGQSADQFLVVLADPDGSPIDGGNDRDIVLRAPLA